MALDRERFIEQFAIAFDVHCLRLWSRRRREAPTHLTPCLHERIRSRGGRMRLSPRHEAGEGKEQMPKTQLNAKLH